MAPHEPSYYQPSLFSVPSESQLSLSLQPCFPSLGCGLLRFVISSPLLIILLVPKRTVDGSELKRLLPGLPASTGGNPISIDSALPDTLHRMNALLFVLHMSMCVPRGRNPTQYFIAAHPYEKRFAFCLFVLLTWNLTASEDALCR